MAGADTVCKNAHLNAAFSWMPDGQGGMMPTPDFLTQAEAIRFVRLDTTETRFPENTLQRYRKAGLKAVQVGKQVLYPRKEIEAFLERQMQINPR